MVEGGGGVVGGGDGVSFVGWGGGMGWKGGHGEGKEAMIKGGCKCLESGVRVLL